MEEEVDNGPGAHAAAQSLALPFVTEVQLVSPGGAGDRAVADAYPTTAASFARDHPSCGSTLVGSAWHGEVRPVISMSSALLWDP